MDVTERETVTKCQEGGNHTHVGRAREQANDVNDGISCYPDKLIHLTIGGERSLIYIILIPDIILWV